MRASWGKRWWWNESPLLPLRYLNNVSAKCCSQITHPMCFRSLLSWNQLLAPSVLTPMGLGTKIRVTDSHISRCRRCLDQSDASRCFRMAHWRQATSCHISLISDGPPLGEGSEETSVVWKNLWNRKHCKSYYCLFFRRIWQANEQGRHELQSVLTKGLCSAWVWLGSLHPSAVVKAFAPCESTAHPGCLSLSQRPLRGEFCPSYQCPLSPSMCSEYMPLHFLFELQFLQL